MQILGKRSLRRLTGVNPLLIAILTESVMESPIDFGIPLHGGRRTESEQFVLYSIGRFGDTRRIVTYRDGYRRKSGHQSGNCTDIFLLIDGKSDWTPANYELVARHIQKIAKERYNVDLIWGGDWKMKDFPHLQLPRKYWV